MSIIVTDELSYEKGTLKVLNYQDGETNKELLDIRGIIKNERDEVVCKSFGYTPEVVLDADPTTMGGIEELNEYIAPMVNDSTRFFVSYEGTILRLWSYQGDWFISTHRKIHANKSKWGCEIPYTELFQRAAQKLNFDTSQLNPDKIYVVLLRSFKLNRKVCLGEEEPSLYLIGTFDRSNNFAFEFPSGQDAIPTPEEITTINTPTDLYKYVKNVDFKKYQGVVAINPDGKSAKIVNGAYDFFDKIRNNEPNVLYRYVQLRWQPFELQHFVQMYPEHKQKFEQWEEVMNHIANNILRKYIERYINHRTAMLPPDQYPVLKALHNLYVNELKPNNKRIELEHVYVVFSTMSERDLNVLYKAYNRRKEELGNGNRCPENLRAYLENTMASKRQRQH